MLSKEHLEYRARQGKISPHLLGSKDPELLAYLARVLEIMPRLVGQRLSLLDQLCAEQGLDFHRLYPAIRKLLTNQLNFHEDASCHERRWEILRHAQELRDEEIFSSHRSFQESIAHRLGREFKEIAEDLYSDLPEQQLIENYQEISPTALIHRYNCAQIQGLLIYSQEISITVENASTDELRGLFRALKFHRLLGEITSEDRAQDQGNSLSMKISGPLSLFQANMPGYGLRIAHFFPHVPLLGKWSLTAKISPPHKAKDQLLSISHKDGITSHYSPSLSHIPEEFKLLIAAFNEKNSQWQMSTSGECLNLGKQNYCIADFVFVHGDGRRVHLELFHKWHWRQLGKRIKTAEVNKQTTLLLGICRSISSRKELADLLPKSPWFKQYGFDFRDFPSVKNLNSILAQFESIGASQLGPRGSK
jgi:predicted nuclease of restriction endonuclease-like RecB superfamily